MMTNLLNTLEYDSAFFAVLNKTTILHFLIILCTFILLIKIKRTQNQKEIAEISWTHNKDEEEGFIEFGTPKHTAGKSDSG